MIIVKVNVFSIEKIWNKLLTQFLFKIMNPARISTKLLSEVCLLFYAVLIMPFQSESAILREFPNFQKMSSEF